MKKAIEEFVRYVKENEPGTTLFVFEDEAARVRHGQSEAVRRFESVYSPELVEGNVVFRVWISRHRYDQILQGVS